MSKKSCAKTAANYLDYMKLLDSGMSKERALAEMKECLHPLSFGKLKKFISAFEGH